MISRQHLSKIFTHIKATNTQSDVKCMVVALYINSKLVVTPATDKLEANNNWLDKYRPLATSELEKLVDAVYINRALTLDLVRRLCDIRSMFARTYYGGLVEDSLIRDVLKVSPEVKEQLNKELCGNYETEFMLSDITTKHNPHADRVLSLYSGEVVGGFLATNDEMMDVISRKGLRKESTRQLFDMAVRLRNYRRDFIAFIMQGDYTGLCVTGTATPSNFAKGLTNMGMDNGLQAKCVWQALRVIDETYPEVSEGGLRLVRDRSL